MQHRALVVTGGTEVDIDDIRVISNRSKGTFGALIALELGRRGCDVTLLASERSIADSSFRMCIRPATVLRTFRTYSELVAQLHQIIDEQRPTLIFMPAAISDYGVKKADGKLSSSEGDMVLQLEKLPKVLKGIRPHTGIECFIVGWKLLSGATREELIEAAQRQLKECRTNLVVANDWQKISKNEHPCLLVTPEGGAVPTSGDKRDVARSIVGFALTRANTTWSHTLMGNDSCSHASPGFAVASRLLKFAQETHLLNSPAGNVSHMANSLANGHPGFYASPRGVDKSTLSPEDFALCYVKPDEGIVHAFGPKKPSIDTAVHGRLYATYPKLAGLLHFHDGFVRPDCTTRFPYPCGTQEEADEILVALKWHTHGPPFTVKLPEHGYLMGFAEGGVDSLIAEWKSVVAEWKEHMTAIGRESMIEATRLHPVIAFNRICGLVANYEDWYSLFVAPADRKLGISRFVLPQLLERKVTIAAGDKCNVRDFYLRHGYEEFELVAPDLVLLRPKSHA